MTQSVEHENARRRAGSKPQVGQPRPPIYMVPPPPTTGISTIWHGDPDFESPEGTTLRDWPTARAFAPLIAAAVRVGNADLVKQLRADQRYCAAMRRKIRQARAEGRQGESRPD